MILKRKLFISLIVTSILLSIPAGITRIEANPFFGTESTKKVAPPPVYSAGSNTFVKLQFEYRDKIAVILRKLKSGETGLYLILIAVSFVYGLFHAAGPGHRKTIVFSLFISHHVNWFEPALAGFISAGIHAGTSIAIIGILFMIQQFAISLSTADNIYAYMEGVTFIAIALISISFILLKIQSLIKLRPKDSSAQKKRLYPLIIVSSLVPCPGATMLLLLSLYTNMLPVGIAGVMAMSFGMGIIISLAGYLAYAGRKGLFLRLKERESSLFFASSILEILSFSIILFFSLLMSWPFIRSIMM